jgi:hypothetical protein
MWILVPKLPHSATKGKRRVYLGSLLALWGGFLSGMGLAGFFIPRTIIAQILAVDANLTLNLEDYSYYQLMAISAVIVGAILAGFGLYYQSRTNKKNANAAS